MNYAQNSYYKSEFWAISTKEFLKNLGNLNKPGWIVNNL